MIAVLIAALIAGHSQPRSPSQASTQWTNQPLLIATSETPSLSPHVPTRRLPPHTRQVCQVGQAVFLVLRLQLRHLGSLQPAGYAQNSRLHGSSTCHTDTLSATTSRPPDLLVRLAADLVPILVLCPAAQRSEPAPSPSNLFGFPQFSAHRQHPLPVSVATRSSRLHAERAASKKKLRLTATTALGCVAYATWDWFGCVAQLRRATAAGACFLIPPTAS